MARPAAECPGLVKDRGDPLDRASDEEDGQEVLDKLASLDSEDKTVDRIHLSNVIKELPERERMVVIMRFFNDKTQSEIAERLGVSQVQVSRMESKIINKMRLIF